MKMTTRLQHAFTMMILVGTGVAATGCCGGLDADEADKVLRVDLEAPVEGESDNPEAPRDAKLCGAEVIATDIDGNTIDLEEIPVEGGCEYVATVEDPFADYTISATHPDLGAGLRNSNSNPACSTPTATEDIDSTLILGEATVEEAPAAEDVAAADPVADPATDEAPGEG